MKPGRIEIRPTEIAPRADPLLAAARHEQRRSGDDLRAGRHGEIPFVLGRTGHTPALTRRQHRLAGVGARSVNAPGRVLAHQPAGIVEKRTDQRLEHLGVLAEIGAQPATELLDRLDADAASLVAAQLLEVFVSMLLAVEAKA